MKELLNVVLIAKKCKQTPYFPPGIFWEIAFFKRAKLIKQKMNN